MRMFLGKALHIDKHEGIDILHLERHVRQVLAFPCFNILGHYKIIGT
jgi:hypothetical protein